MIYNKYDLRWMEQVVEMLCRTCQTNTQEFNLIVKRFSMGLLCEYTKALLVQPVRLASCHHLYCLEKEVLEELK